MIYKILGLILIMPLLVFFGWAFFVAFASAKVPANFLKINPLYIALPIGAAFDAGIYLLFK